MLKNNNVFCGSNILQIGEIKVEWKDKIREINKYHLWLLCTALWILSCSIYYAQPISKAYDKSRQEYYSESKKMRQEGFKTCIENKGVEYSTLYNKYKKNFLIEAENRCNKEKNAIWVSICKGNSFVDDTIIYKIGEHAPECRKHFDGDLNVLNKSIPEYYISSNYSYSFKKLLNSIFIFSTFLGLIILFCPPIFKLTPLALNFLWGWLTKKG